jgi:hypothetical protein
MSRIQESHEKACCEMDAIGTSVAGFAKAIVLGFAGQPRSDGVDYGSQHLGLIAVVHPVHANDDASRPDNRVHDELGERAEGLEHGIRENKPDRAQRPGEPGLVVKRLQRFE